VTSERAFTRPRSPMWGHRWWRCAHSTRSCETSRPEGISGKLYDVADPGRGLMTTPEGQCDDGCREESYGVAVKQLNKSGLIRAIG